jgi:hypothetical protein
MLRLDGIPKSNDLDSIKTYSAAVAERYERIVGRKAKNVPIWITLGISARDKDNLRLDADPGMFVEVPVEKLIARPPHAKPQEKPVRLIPQVAEATRPSPPASIAVLHRRLDDLDRKIEQLSAKIDALTHQFRDNVIRANAPDK